ncbi:MULTISPECIES: low molecular weight protein tyrosine phosphatase family protein [unclassified Pseudomonas]|uniref:low molecular weight protein tyrosine phosphatase family protein n=1 Tax=unclassified Pseudomonas TaxID=196821 RepID=UPI002448FE9D|nr:MULTISPECIES: low molecular weight protein tyrosine phosphatase family protein [unclassified Pseudomonas]MDH0895759.1 low molecular weight protein tyrosine phosphatase family protein [Pseudomonas sp. GD03875]MDH1066593.1 low molecular weight protein tyrosine phosphatase family protein [Pseudomonas sp. GD03985]
MTRALFICSRNRLRSPTAEQLFAGWPGVESDSACLAPDAEVPLSAEQVEWAELIFVMERAHQKRLQQRFGSLLRGRQVICLGIPDDYNYMQPELVELLEARVGSYLR